MTVNRVSFLGLDESPLTSVHPREVVATIVLKKSGEKLILEVTESLGTLEFMDGRNPIHLMVGDSLELTMVG